MSRTDPAADQASNAGLPLIPLRGQQEVEIVMDMTTLPVPQALQHLLTKHPAELAQQPLVSSDDRPPAVIETTADVAPRSVHTATSSTSKITMEEEASDSEEASDVHKINNNNNPLAARNRYPIDGGRRAWMVVVASFLIHFVAFGLYYTFGILQESYERDQVFPSSSSLTIAIAGTIGPALIFVTGAITGKMAERIGYQKTILLGSVVLPLGIFLAGFSTQAWHLILTQGVLYGVGASLLFFPGVSLPSQWWEKRRSLAIGIAMAGSGVGGVVFSSVSTKLIPAVGVLWTMRILGCSTFALLLVATALVRTRLPPQVDDNKRGPLIDFSMLRSPTVWPIMAGAFFMPFGYMLPFYYLPPYTENVFQSIPGLKMTLLNIINILSIVGRIGMGTIADRTGNINSYLTCVLLAGVSMLAFWLPAGASTVPLLYVFAATYGFFAGGFISLMPTVAAQLFGIEKLPSIIGLLYTATVPGTLLGSPMAAAIIGAAESAALRGAEIPEGASAQEIKAIATRAAAATWGPAAQYAPAILFACATVFIASAFVCYLRFVVVDRRLRALV